jgi:hypothetical protein
LSFATELKDPLSTARKLFLNLRQFITQPVDFYNKNNKLREKYFYFKKFPLIGISGNKLTY